MTKNEIVKLCENELNYYDIVDECSETVEFGMIIDFLIEKGVVEALLPVIENLYAAIVPLICSVAASVIKARHDIMCLYPYKKIVHLALYHPKKRVRKKNETEWDKIKPEGYFPAWECTKCGNIIVEEDECISLPNCEKCKDRQEKSTCDSFKILGIDFAKSRDYTANVGRSFSEIYTHEAGGNEENAE